MTDSPADATPVRRQYLEIKRRYPHAILFFRLGDFYETFDDDARTCARELDITLTTRPVGKQGRIPLAGVPYHAIDGYVARLMARGYKVAICDQIGEASGRKVIERQVTRVLTPGTLVDEALLDGRSNNYLAALIAVEGVCGLAQIDVSTGEFAVTQLEAAAARAELLRLRPAELLIGGDDLPGVGAVCGSITRLDASSLSVRAAGDSLLAHFGAVGLEPYGCAQLPAAICAAAAVLRYLGETQPAALPLVQRLSTYDGADWMTLDAQTLRNLEVFENSRDRGRAGSLLEAIDATRTPMGGRLLRARLGRPLLDPEAIAERLDSVAWFYERGLLRERVLALLAAVPDLERLLTRIATGRGSARDLLSLRRGIATAAELRSLRPSCRPARSSALPIASAPRSSTTRRPASIQAGPSGRATPRNSTNCGRWQATRATTSRRLRHASASAPVCARSRSATTASSATTSRSATCIAAPCRTGTSADRRLPGPSATPRLSSSATRPRRSGRRSRSSSSRQRSYASWPPKLGRTSSRSASLPRRSPRST
jgi:DNA mismatch repair ATPase MutS